MKLRNEKVAGQILITDCGPIEVDKNGFVETEREGIIASLKVVGFLPFFVKNVEESVEDKIEDKIEDKVEEKVKVEEKFEKFKKGKGKKW